VLLEGVPPGVFSYVWQAKDLKSSVFVSVAMKGVTSAFFGCVAGKGLSRIFVWAREWSDAVRRREDAALTTQL
jgi:hypothetical protein